MTLDINLLRIDKDKPIEYFCFSILEVFTGKDGRALFMYRGYKGEWNLDLFFIKLK